MSNDIDEGGPRHPQNVESPEPAPQETVPPPVPAVSLDREAIPKQKFALSKSNGIYVALAIALGVAAFIADPVKSGYQMGTHTGRIVAFCMFPLLVAWIVWRCSGRKSKPASLGFNVTLTLCLLGQLPEFINRPQEDRTLEELKRKREAFRNEAASTNDPSKLRSAAKKYVESVKENFEDSASKSTGVDKRAHQILNQDLAAAMAAVKEWGASRTAVGSTMNFDRSLLADGEFDRRRNALGVYVKKTKAYIEFYTNFLKVTHKGYHKVAPKHRAGR